MLFRSEGTDAAKPENFLPEEEKALLGDWVSASVTDVMGDDASNEVSPSAITATLNPDHSSIISFDLGRQRIACRSRFGKTRRVSGLT